MQDCGVKFILLWMLMPNYVYTVFQEIWMPNKSDYNNSTIPMGNVTVSVGREANFECMINSTSKYKTNKFAWIKAENHTILSIGAKIITHNHRISVSQDNYFTQLRIKQIKEIDKGCYWCVVGVDVFTAQEICLEVNVSPDILNENTSGDLSIPEGDNTTLWCKASGNPKPRITWRKENNNETIFLRKSLQTFEPVEIFHGSDLNFWKVDRMQMGNYLCIASNDVPPAISKRVSLYVNFAPTIQVPNQLLGAPINTDVLLECYVEAFPNTINYWIKNRSEMLLNGTKYVIGERKYGYKVDMWIIIKSFTSKDVGTYNCVSTNSLGKSEGTLRLYEIKVHLQKSTRNRLEYTGDNKGEITRTKMGLNNSFSSTEHIDKYLLLITIIILKLISR